MAPCSAPPILLRNNTIDSGSSAESNSSSVRVMMTPPSISKKDNTHTSSSSTPATLPATPTPSRSSSSSSSSAPPPPNDNESIHSKLSSRNRTSPRTSPLHHQSSSRHLAASQRLVEYFVVVSAVPEWEKNKKKHKKNPRQPSTSTTTTTTTTTSTPTTQKRKSAPWNKCTNEEEILKGVVLSPDEELPPPPPPSPRNRTLQSESAESTAAATTTSQTTEGNIHMPLEGGESQTFYPKITSRYPLEDHKDNPMNPMVVHFCHPHADVLYGDTQYHLPKIHHFVLTNDKGRKVYGTCLTFYEEFIVDGNLQSSLMNRHFGDCIQEKQHPDQDDVEVSLNPLLQQKQTQILYIPKVLCILSTWPYLTAFREYLTQLYRLVTSRHYDMDAPLERYISNLCCEIPAPPPGVYEVQVPILDSIIRFWAPPAKMPVAYVALEYQLLFESLELSNVMELWYALMLEGKVLLVSSHYSLLTKCAELLLSLLFPMQWSHLYIPLVPRFLSPILDAPMPYLCGVVRDNWLHAQQFVSQETIVVDLDCNTITTYMNLSLPSPPTKRWTKLTEELEHSIVGDLFWKARDMDKEFALREKQKFSKQKFDQLFQTQNQKWRLQRAELDEALSLSNLVYKQEDSSSQPILSALVGGADHHANLRKWDRVQDAFLRFYVSVLKDYRRYLVIGKEDDDEKMQKERWSTKRYFDSATFIQNQKAEYHDFLFEFCHTQQFDDFITKRLYSPGEPDVIFFDQSIDAKLNRSRLKVRKLETPFLRSAKAHKVLNTITAIPPSTVMSEHSKEDNGDQMESNVVVVKATSSSSNGKKRGVKNQNQGRTRSPTQRYKYNGKWPQRLDSSKFGDPRPIPSMITTEFDRQAALVEQLRAPMSSPDDHQESTHTTPSTTKEYANDSIVYNSDSNPQVATFTVFFMTYAPMIGREWQTLLAERTNTGNDEDEDDEPPQNDTELEEARDVAIAQLDLAFDVLDMMTLRGLIIEADAATYLMEACGRCGDTRRATQLMKFMAKEGLVASSEMQCHFMMAFAQGEQSPHKGFDNDGGIRKLGSSSAPDAYSSYLNKQLDASKNEKKNSVDDDSTSLTSRMCPMFWPIPVNNPTPGDAYDDDQSDHSDSQSSMSGSTKSVTSDGDTFTGTLNSFSGSLAESILGPIRTKQEKHWIIDELSKCYNYWSGVTPTERKANRMRRKLKRRKKRSLWKARKAGLDHIVTDRVQKQLDMGDNFLTFLYPELGINMSSDSCPQCSSILTQTDIVSGWRPCQGMEVTTKCPNCTHRFVAGFSVKTTCPTFEGSQGMGTPLYCEFVSPWVLMKELQQLYEEDLVDPQWRKGAGINATLWWNMIVLFMRYQLPVSYLLQGSFPNRLINPDPEHSNH